MRQYYQIDFLNNAKPVFGIKKLIVFAILVLFMLLASVSSGFAENNVGVRAEVGEGYGRIVFDFDEFPDYKLEILEGVLVLRFNEEVNIEVDALADILSDYIVVARVDPDNTAVRIALAQEVKVNKLEAADKLFIDLLPRSWRGLLPALPPEVVVELALRAEEAELSAREQILRRELRKPKNELVVRYGELPTFTRLFFDWRLDVETKLERNGKIVTLRFDHYAKPVIRDLKASPPKYLKKIDYSVTRRELVVNLTLEKGTDVRGFKEGTGFVIDLSKGDGGQLQRLNETVSDSDIAALGGLLVQDDEGKKDRNEIEFLAPSLGDDSVNDEEPQAVTTPEAVPVLNSEIIIENNEPAAEDVAVATELPEKRETPVDEIEFKENALEKGEIRGSQTVKIALDKVTQDDEIEENVDTRLPKFLAGTSNTDNFGNDENISKAKPKNYKPVLVEAEKVKVEALRSNREYKITFPFKDDIAVAAFELNDLFWLVFEKKIDFDISELEAVAPELIKVVDVQVIDNSTTVRLKFDKRLLPGLGAMNSDWILSIGELVLIDTKVVKLARKYKQNGHAIVQVNMSDLGKVHWFTDEKLGDRIAVITAKGPARGILKTHNFVEFAALPTVHGLMFQAIADDINVAANFDQAVISSREGLSLTVGQNYSRQLSVLNNGDIKRPSAIEFKDLRRDAWQFTDRRRELNKLIDDAETEKDQSIYRLEMIEFLLSYQMANEALGMLAFEKFKAPTSANSARYKSLEGAAYTLAGKYNTAMNALSAVSIRNNKTAKLFRAYALSKTGAHQESIKEFDASQEMLAQLPPKMEANFLIAAVESALEIPNLNAAQKHLIMLGNVMETDFQKAKYWMLMARFSEMNDEVPEAILRYRAAADYDIRPVSAEANGKLSMLEYQTGVIKIDEAIDQLSGNVMMWRGDKIEQTNTLNLGKLYMDKGKYREGFALLKTAVSKFDSAEIGRDTAKYMSEVFEALYLGGKASEMLPFKALGLFYDFRELTPIGRKGDEMIRNLADRLIDVDLLDQAIELLDHQVNKRLTGIAKADVAAKLAMVQLLNYQPEKTIVTIAKTRIANMPTHITRKRDLLEARALVEIGRTQSAITRLEGYRGKDVSAIKSEAYWRGSYWQKAGEEFETMVANRWQDDVPLLDNERHILLRSAIAYKMAEDDLALGRLRKQYMRKMENTSHAGSFNLVVDEAATDAVGFRKLAREIAEVDLLKEFISDFRVNEAKDIRDRNNQLSGVNASASG
ncbi:MAG: hypothetical protein COC24_013210 [Alphaproteobacteria bacterium]|nr:hypothetical protein [Alphaproteobacteria bacterium]